MKVTVVNENGDTFLDVQHCDSVGYARHQLRKCSITLLDKYKVRVEYSVQEFLNAPTRKPKTLSHYQGLIDDIRTLGGIERCLLDKDEIKMAENLVLLGRLRKGTADTRQGNVKYFPV